MPMASVNGVELYWEATGQGAPVVWVHEYGGDLRSWEPQVRYFSRRYRVVALRPVRSHRARFVQACGRPKGRARTLDDAQPLDAPEGLPAGFRQSARSW